MRRAKAKGEFFEETYAARIVILNPCSSDELGRYVIQVTGKTLEVLPHPEFNGHTLHLIGYCHIIAMRCKWRGELFQSGSLSHEVAHVVEDILWARGLKHIKATREAWAYLQGSILRRALEVLRA